MNFSSKNSFFDFSNTTQNHVLDWFRYLIPSNMASEALITISARHKKYKGKKSISKMKEILYNWEFSPYCSG